ncbi:uncharacterized protein M6B38_415670 [Iris pallida]|uniref:30S ribosomal protein S6 n=1 Tax=Iris pallida TaxID=29817 RepID=A0AAX6FK89_IRIPA|nr:uncharacterized protein M6B38_415670 [Iris pallida]
MEVRPMTSSSSSLPRLNSKFPLHRSNSSNTFRPNVLSCRKKSGSVVVAAGGKKKNDRKGKANTHSFIPKPEEATGPFPEAVMLKKEVVKEDGRVEPEFEDAEEEKLYEFLSLQLESGLNVERMRHYEVVYLIHEDRVDEVDNVISKVQDFIREKKGRIYRLNNWGLRRLAYKIQKAKNANYVLMNFELEAKCINEFKTMLDRDERIIRHLVIKRDEAITEDCPPPVEFHTLRGMDDSDDDDEEEYDDEGEDWDDEDDLEMDGDGENIFVIGEEEDEADDDLRRSSELEVKKMSAR